MGRTLVRNNGRKAIDVFTELMIIYKNLGFDDIPIGVDYNIISFLHKQKPVKNSLPESSPKKSQPHAATNKAKRSSSKIPPTAHELESVLKEIRMDMGDCKKCKLHGERKNIVFGEGDGKAQLMFIGEGPGADEDEQGRPFVGRAGQVLTNLIYKMGLTRDDVYIANMVKCRPPGNRNPEPDEVAACMPFLLRQIDAIKPEIVVTLGSVSTRALLNTDGTIGKMRGKFHDYRGAKLLPTFHPSYLLRNPKEKLKVWEDAKKVLRFLNLEIVE